MRLNAGRPVLACAGGVVLCLAGCAQTPLAPEPVTITQVSFADVPGWSADHAGRALSPLQRECRRLARLPASEDLGGAGLAHQAAGTPLAWQPACRAALAADPLDDAASRQMFQTWFAPYRIGAPAEITGYFEPEVAGATRPGGGFDVPLLGQPGDLVTRVAAGGGLERGRMLGGVLVPYPDRAAIEAGALGAQARPLLWLRSRIDLFFLQVQGAGRVRLPDGSVLRVGFDGQNGRPYTPIGRVLADRGDIPADGISLQSIRAWLEAHPAEADAVMDQNQDYVFFRLLPAGDEPGPPGAMGVALTPGRSAAIDRAIWPLGVPLWIDTADPLTGGALRRLVLGQDLGTDVRGPARADLFMGAGDRAAQAAGRMHATGQVWVLLPRGVGH